MFNNDEQGKIIDKRTGAHYPHVSFTIHYKDLAL